MFSSFMVNTWIVATLVAVVAGMVGFFVVLRGSSFAAHALPLGAFPGAAAANLLGINEFFCVIVSAGLGVIGISQLSRRGRHDVATALCLVTLLGLGTVFLSMAREYSQGTYALLFGEVLGVSTGEIVPVAVMSAMVIVAITLMFRPLLLSSVSPELAKANGVSTNRMELCFLTIVAFGTSVALPVVGTLLVFSLMVGPAAAARSLTNRPIVALFFSIGIALVTVWASIGFSFISDWPVGFFVGAIGMVSYVLGRVWDKGGMMLPIRATNELG